MTTRSFTPLTAASCSDPSRRVLLARTALAGASLVSPFGEVSAQTTRHSPNDGVLLTGSLRSSPEARLIEVYRAVARGDRQALPLAAALVRDVPGFQLGQLVYADLLLAHSGNAPGLSTATDGPPVVRERLRKLRAEANRRLGSLTEMPPPGTVPEQVLQLARNVRHVVAVDASHSRLYVFEQQPHGLQLIRSFYASIGQAGFDKRVEGDLRTPLGVYFITSRLDPAKLKDFYGAGALPINYPNPLDQSRGKTGSGIWLHGTPPDQFSRAPLATDGCLVLANPDLERILRTVEPRSTPVVIAKQLQWVQAHSVQAERNSFEAVLNAWSAAKSEGNMNRLLGFYAPDFQSYKKKPLSEWATVLQAESQALKGRPVHLKDKAYLRWTDSADTMVVTFGEVAEGARTGPIKRQYWTRRGQQWQIFFEGVIG